MLGTAAGINQTNPIALLYEWRVVVRAQEYIHPFKALEQVKSLKFKHLSIALTGSAMHADYHHVGISLSPELVHTSLHERKQALEFHIRPQALVQPSRNVRISVTHHQNLQPGSLKELVFREIRLSIGFQGISCHKRDSLSGQLSRDPVVHCRTRLDVVITHDDGIVVHI